VSDILIWIGIIYGMCALWCASILIKEWSRGDEKPNILKLTFYTVIVILCPLLLIIVTLLYKISPATEEPFLLIYGKLDYSKGKTALQIETEINDAGQSCGAFNLFLEANLKTMVIEGMAKKREEVITNSVAFGSVMEVETYYLKGNPPTKNKKRQRYFLSAWKPQYV